LAHVCLAFAGHASPCSGWHRHNIPTHVALQWPVDSSKLQPLALAALTFATPHAEYVTAAACEESNAARAGTLPAPAPRHIELSHVERAASAPSVPALDRRVLLSAHVGAVASASGTLTLGNADGAD
jgi:hypothetical protein